MSLLNRRDFLHDSAALAALLAGGAGAFAAPKKKTKAAKKGDANDQLHVAVIGVRGRGRDHIKGLAGKHGCVITTVCDADEGVIGPAMKAVEQAQGKAPNYVKDLRKVMDDKSIDLVSIATPNHWHALAAVWALQAGKDVYVEKPVSHNVREGRLIVEAARKHGRVCQTGTQSRSSTGLKEAVAFLKSGGIGKVHLARGLCYKLRPSIGKVGKGTVPATCDYNLWCGPAPMKPLTRQKLHYDWHWTWDYGNGDLGNQGIHEMDKARWGLGKNDLPKSVVSIGGRFGYVDDGETANTQICVFDYGDCELIFEVRGLPTKDLLGVKVGNVFYGSNGYLVMPSYSSATAFDLKGNKLKEFKGGGDHYGNFVQAVRARKPETLHADILEGHLSSALCHLGNISYRLGTLQPFAKKAKAFGDDKEAYETLARMEAHLKDNKVPLDQTSYRLGPKLAIEAKVERFVGNPQADAMLTRVYREPFAFSGKV